MDSQAWLDELRVQYRRHKDVAERASAQVPGEAFFTEVADHLSLAIALKHVGGNHRSRWRNFLTTDGEKDDRDRDSEFIVAGETRESVEAVWQSGWEIALAELDALQPADLERTVTIRGEPHTVVQALLRNLTHTSYHAGQIVTLAKHLAGDQWQSLSVPVGESNALNARMREKHGNWTG